MRARAAKERDPGSRDRRRRLLVGVDEGPALRPVPVRRPGLRAGQHPRASASSSRPAARVPRGHFSTFDEFSGDLPMRRERPFQAWLQISQGCNCDVLVLHRAVACAGASSRRPADAIRAEVEALDRRRRARGDAARPERQLLGPRPAGRRAHRLRRPAAAARRRGRPRAHPLHEPAPQGHARRRDRRAPRVPHRLRARAPAAAVGLHAHPQGDAPHLLAERYLRLAERLRDEVPGIALTTDIIVGFPGETEDDFQRTLEVCERVAFDHAFTFVYSPRRGTDAAAMDGQVPEEVKRERMERLVERIQSDARRAQRRARRARCRRCSSRARRAPTRRTSRGRTRTNKTAHRRGLALPGLARRRAHRRTPPRRRCAAARPRGAAA